MSLRLWRGKQAGQKCRVTLQQAGSWIVDVRKWSVTDYLKDFFQVECPQDEAAFENPPTIFPLNLGNLGWGVKNTPIQRRKEVFASHYHLVQTWVGNSSESNSIEKAVFAGLNCEKSQCLPSQSKSCKSAATYTFQT
jgi:hypothetical protein